MDELKGKHFRGTSIPYAVREKNDQGTFQRGRYPTAKSLETLWKQQICSRVAIINHGQLITETTIEDLISSKGEVVNSSK